MNKSFNIWFILIFILSMPLILSDFFNSDLTLPFMKPSAGVMYLYEYKEYYVYSLGLLYFIVGLRKASRKWVGLLMSRQTNKFRFTEPIGKERKTRVLMYSITEVVFLGIFAYFYCLCSELVLILGLILIILAVEHLVHLILGFKLKWYRVGITARAIFSVDREVKSIYYTGLRKVFVQQDTIYFEYIKELTLTMPSDIIPKDELPNFKAEFEKHIDLEKVYLSPTYKEL